MDLREGEALERAQCIVGRDAPDKEQYTTYSGMDFLS